MSPKIRIVAGCGGAILLLLGGIVWFILAGLCRSSHKAVGGNWVTETKTCSLGGDSSFQWMLRRKSPSVLIEERLGDLQYCGDDCVLYKVARTRASPHFRAACGDRQPAIFQPPDLISWEIKDCGLRRELGNHEVVVTRAEIRKKAMAQPKARLRRRHFKLEYVDAEDPWKADPGAV